MTLDLEPIEEPSVKLDLEPIEGVATDPGRTPLSQTPYPARMEDVGISGTEFEGVQPVELPLFGKPGTFTRGISKGLTGAVQFATSTPGVALAPAMMVPGVGAAIGTGMSAYAIWEAAQKAEEAIEKKSPEAAGEAVFMGGLGALGARAAVKSIPASARLISPEATTVLPKSAREAITAPERLLTGTGRPMPEFAESSVTLTQPEVAPASRQLVAPRIISPEFAESTLLEAARTGQPVEAVERIELPIEPETAKAARQIWSKRVDPEAQAEGATALRQLVSITEEQKTPGQPYKPPTVSVDLRQLERRMQRNTVSTVEGWADQVIQERLKRASGNPFLDPEFMAAAITKGAILFKRGLNQIGAWSDEMRKQFGRGFDDQLPVIFQKSKEYWESRAPIPETPPTAEPIEAESMPGVMVDKSIAPAIIQINEYGLRTINSDSGLRVDHPGKTKVQRGYVTFDVVDPRKWARVAQAGKESGFIVEDVQSHEGSGAEFVGTTKTVTLRIPNADLSDMEKASMWKSLVEKLQPTSIIDPVFQPSALTTEASKTVGITPSPVAPLDLGQKLSSAIRKWFTVAGHLPQEVHEAAVKMENLRGASDFQIKMMARDLMEALKEVYGLSSLEVAGGGSRRIPVSAVQLMDDYLHNRVANPTRIPAPVRSVLDTMRSEMDANSSQIITELTRQANQLPGNSPKAVSLHNLINKIKDNMGIYVHRAYKFFDSSEGAADWYKNLSEGIKIKAEDYIMQNGPFGMTQAEAQSRILDWLSDLKGDSTFTGGSTLGAKDLSIFMKRGVIAPELRAVLGEYHNPLANYATSMSKMADWVAKQRFQKEVRRVGMGRFLFEQGTNPPGFNTEIAGQTSKVLSELAGLRTSEEIAAALHDLSVSSNPGTIAKAYLTLNAFSKFAATGLSMLTQARNLASRPFMALMAGHTQLGKAGRSVKAIAQDFAGNNATWKAYLQRLYELGVLGDTARAGELQAIIKDAALRDTQPNALFHWSLGQAIKKYGYRIPAEIYRLSDELGNVFGFENEKAIQSRIHPNWTPEQVELEAAKITRELYPVYSETPRGVKAFRRVAIVGPFVIFPYQMYRTVFNVMARTIHELRSSNPVERRVGAKRLAGQMAAIAGTAAVAETGKALLGINQQQEEDFRRFQPSWSKNSKWLFTAKDDKGKLSGVNLSYLDPYSYITDPINAIISSVRTGRSIQETVLETMKESLRPWISPQMLAQAISEAYQGKTESGREIWNKTDSGVDIATKSVQHVAGVLKPGTLQRIERRILPAIRNEQPLYGRKLELGPEIARELTGLAIEQFDFRNGLAFRARTFTDMDREAEGIFHKTISRTQTTTPQDLIASYQEADRRRFLIWQEMRKDFLAAVRQGVTVPEARKLMVARGVSQEDARAISNGRYLPLAITDQSRKRARERNRVLPMAELNTYRQQAAKRSLDER